MKVLSIVSQKGGTGKTSLATHLSVEAERNGHTTALIDLDPKRVLRSGEMTGNQIPLRLSQRQPRG